MKRHIVTVSLLGTMLGAGTINSQAAPPPNHPESFAQAPAGDAPPPNEMAPPPKASLQREISSLNLTADQEKQIADILAKERKKISPLMKKMDGFRTQLRLAEQAPVLDEPGLRVIASDLAKTETELIVSHAKMNRRVMAILTPTQRELLQQQAPERQSRPGPPRLEKEPGPDSEHRR